LVAFLYFCVLIVWAHQSTQVEPNKSSSDQIGAKLRLGGRVRDL